MERFDDANLKKSLNLEFGLPVALLRGGAACPESHHFGVTQYFMIPFEQKRKQQYV